MAGSDPVLLEVGRVDKVHGLRGEVVVSLVTNVEGRLDTGTVLFRGAERAPLRVAAARPHQHRYLVRFEGVEDRAAAESLRGVVLYAEELDEPDALWVHRMIGARLVTVDGTERGVVAAVLDNPAADLLELDTGALVPLTFVLGWDGPGVLVADTPLGLFDDGSA